MQKKFGGVNVELLRYGEGFCFGEGALINHTARTASAIALNFVDLFTLDETAFNLSFSVYIKLIKPKPKPK